MVSNMSPEPITLSSTPIKIEHLRLNDICFVVGTDIVLMVDAITVCASGTDIVLLVVTIAVYRPMALT